MRKLLALLAFIPTEALAAGADPAATGSADKAAFEIRVYLPNACILLEQKKTPGR